MKKPELGDELASAHSSDDTLALLRTRRSTPADLLGGPGPDQQTLSDMLEIAARVPDHRRVAPFRFMVFVGEACERFGATLARIFAEQTPDAEAAKIDYERQRFMRAPVVIAVISKIDPAHRTPEWEQILTSGAACQNLLIAASAHGFAAQWITEWYAYDKAVLKVLGLTEKERIAGYVYIGTAREEPKERGRPDMGSIVSMF